MASWVRLHLKTAEGLVALALCVDGKYRASSTPSPRFEDFDSEDAAMDRADEMIQTAYPHDCVKTRCWDWDRFMNN